MPDWSVQRSPLQPFCCVLGLHSDPFDLGRLKRGLGSAQASVQLVWHLQIVDPRVGPRPGDESGLVARSLPRLHNGDLSRQEGGWPRPGRSEPCSIEQGTLCIPPRSCARRKQAHRCGWIPAAGTYASACPWQHAAISSVRFPLQSAPAQRRLCRCMRVALHHRPRSAL